MVEFYHNYCRTQEPVIPKHKKQNANISIKPKINSRTSWIETENYPIKIISMKEN